MAAPGWLPRTLLGTLEAIFLCLNHPRTKYQAAGDHPYSPKPTEIIQTIQSSTVKSKQKGLTDIGSPTKQNIPQDDMKGQKPEQIKKIQIMKLVFF